MMLVSLLTLFSCEKRAVAKPDNLIEKDKMVDILYDVAIIQAASTVNASKFAEEGIQPDSYIYKKYGVDSVAFAASNRYYASDPHNYKKMYGEIFYRLEENMKSRNKEALQQTGKAIAPSDAPAIQ